MTRDAAIARAAELVRAEAKRLELQLADHPCGCCKIRIAGEIKALLDLVPEIAGIVVTGRKA